jgi:PPK2 family polyphosphate:nucleotide phosphotransferase
MSDTAKRIARFIEPFRVSPGADVELARDFDPAFRAGIEKKKDGAELLESGIELLSERQARLAAQDTHGVLVVLQALDAAGKDGAIRHVMRGVNPQGVRVESFKVPSERELDQDFLRRYQQRLPARGEIGIFNRSHYEEVLVVRVHPENLARQKLPPETLEHQIWKRRFEAINEWERYLTDNGFRIVKIFLNISKEEQRIRFLRRIDLPKHRWKFSARDVQERRYWDAYQDAFSEMLSHTSTAWAPWYVVPADRKWFARIGVAAVIAHALIELDPQYPTIGADALRDLEAARAQLESEAPDGAAPDPFEAQEKPREPSTLTVHEG